MADCEEVTLSTVRPKYFKIVKFAIIAIHSVLIAFVMSQLVLIAINSDVNYLPKEIKEINWFWLVIATVSMTVSLIVTIKENLQGIVFFSIVIVINLIASISELSSKPERFVTKLVFPVLYIYFAYLVYVYPIHEHDSNLENEIAENENTV